ncbi:SpoIIIAH-like family protein [Pseudalkalibacillus berkeleyi]|uniref:SpoIIIAH-like family protein n=1 Tax=Pseudalkalibacillus berkeleyi TaxID=1069813 RepID=A0ABS9H206_9BACL|nr:SpoIIIAH-like family protein [Pseudalkalibacillus berkeleyi]MCF6137855.1 SpoIIIAH-like family protein [Pseudalkalibacillus berkeleyi]
MLLKKQTVWLLTMLSLIIVLSVYYITSPEQSPTDLAKQQEGQEASKNGAQDGVEGPSVTQIDSDELFMELRMKMDEQRSKLAHQYDQVIANTSVAAEVQSEALDKLTALQELGMKESTLETLIKSMGYEDVLVNTMGKEVTIIVRVEEKLSGEEANAIMRKAKEQLGDKQVAVQFHTAKN